MRKREDVEHVVLDTYQPVGYNKAVALHCRRKGWSKTEFLQRAIERMCSEELEELGIALDPEHL